MRCSALPLASKCRGSWHLTSGYGSAQSRVGTAFHEAARAKALSLPFDFESIRTKYALTDAEMRDIDYCLYNLQIRIPIGAITIADNKEMTGFNGKLTGTPDLSIFNKSVLTVVDWKKGFLDVESPETNNQLMGYAIMTLDELVKAGQITAWEDVSRIDLMIIQPKLNQVKTYSFSPEDLRARAKDIELIIDEAESEKGAKEFTTGQWCQSCFKSMNCPAFAGQMQALAQFIEPTIETTPHDVEKALRILLPFAKSVNTMAKKVEDLAKAWVIKNGPLDLGGGAIYAPVVGYKQQIEAKKAFETLKEYFDEDRIWEMMSISLTKIREFAVATKRGLSTIVNNRLKETGAITEDVSITYKIIKGADKEENAARIQE